MICLFEQTLLPPPVLQMSQEEVSAEGLRGICSGNVPMDLCGDALRMCLRSIKCACQVSWLCSKSTHLRTCEKYRLWRSMGYFPWQPNVNHTGIGCACCHIHLAKSVLGEGVIFNSCASIIKVDSICKITSVKGSEKPLSASSWTSSWIKAETDSNPFICWDSGANLLLRWTASLTKSD